MVAQLLLPKTSLEVTISAFLRFARILIVAMCQIVLLMVMRSPVNIWMNITAVGFVNELCQQILEVAKRGVFGHHICKEMTEMNFTLFFVSEYPWWFGAVRTVCLVAATIFIVFFAFVTFTMPDQICPDGVDEVPNIFLGFGVPAWMVHETGMNAAHLLAEEEQTNAAAADATG